MNVVAKQIYQKAANLALKEGLPSNLLAHHASPLLANNAKTFVPLNNLLEVYELGHKHLEPGFNIRLGANMIPEDYGTVGLSWKTVSRPRDIFERTLRYNLLTTNTGGIQITNFDDKSIINLNRASFRLGQTLSNETTLVVCLNMIRTITQADINPLKVSFVHKAPESIAAHTDFFKCEVQFAQSTNSIVFLRKDLDIPTIKADKSIHRFMLERMDEELKGIEKQSNQLVSDISLLIKEALPSGIPSIGNISKHLGMSSRTLTRRLVNSEVTFRQIVKDTQATIAKQLLHSSTQSVSEIAFLTGFSEQSAFNRAFKKWTNQTPIEFRKNS